MPEQVTPPQAVINVLLSVSSLIFAQFVSLFDFLQAITRYYHSLLHVSINEVIFLALWDLIHLLSFANSKLVNTISHHS